MTARAPSLALTIVTSTEVPGDISVRAVDGERSFRSSLKDAGFQAGDRVVLRLADQPEPAVVTIEVWHEEDGWCARVLGDTAEPDWCTTREAALEDARDCVFFDAVSDSRFADGVRFLVVDRQETTPAGGAT